MIRQVLKKDMKRRKSVNMILFLFITIASIFLSSSINNILVVISSIDYYMDYANVPTTMVITTGINEKEEVDEWIEKKASGVNKCDYTKLIPMGSKDIIVKNDKGNVEFQSDGASIYMGTTDSDYCKVFDLEGKDFTLASNEIGILKSAMDKNGLKEGDFIDINLGNIKKEFKIKTAIKDAAFGHDMIGMNRIILNQLEFEQFLGESGENIIGLHYVDTDNSTEFINELDTQNFSTIINTINKDIYKMVYSFDMIMAALLIVIGICLILIALLVLRFTLVFTMEEDYREIGIMKAIGLKGFSIKKLYLTKYFVIVTTGAIVGLIVSIPVSRIMVSGVSKNMIMADSSTNIGVNVLCTFLIIFLVMVFCYHCTRKLNKISAISAIRDGNQGENYGRKHGISLHKRKRLPVPAYLGINDMLSHTRRYLVLIVTFCLSFILITIPLNTLNTMQSSEMANKFMLDYESTVYVYDIEDSVERSYKTNSELKAGLERLKYELKEKGYEAQLTSNVIYFFTYGEEGSNSKHKIMTTQIIGPNNDYLSYQEGTAPLLENEIAFSKQILEENGWEVGSTVEAVINGEKTRLIITGTYSDYMQLGKSARMNSKIDLSSEAIFDYWNIMVDMETEKSQTEMVEEFSSLLPDYKWTTSQEIVDGNVGGIQQSLKALLLPMTGMLCGVIMLITLLMERLFIVREQGEIAMMKSIGFKNRVIRLWQVLRIIGSVLLSMIIAVPLSFLSNRFILKPVFAIMGADVTIQVFPLQVYVVYPGILMIGIVIATVIATGKIKKINIRELNNLE